MYLFTAELDALMIAVIMVGLIASCSDSGPTGNNEESPSPDAPDSVSYNNIYGEWEGAIPYANPEEDPYESDSLYFPHFGIYKKKAAVGDSIGYVKWDNKDEYCQGTLRAYEQPPGDSIAVKIATIGAQDGKPCLSTGSNIIRNLRYGQSEDQPWIELPEKFLANDPGKLYPKTDK